MRTIGVAAYSYDSSGKLREAWDPRLDYTDGTGSHHLADACTYDSDGILSTITPAAEQAWTFAYATIPGDTGKGRLATTSRSALSAGTAATTVVYSRSCLFWRTAPATAQGSRFWRL